MPYPTTKSRKDVQHNEMLGFTERGGALGGRWRLPFSRHVDSGSILTRRRPGVLSRGCLYRCGSTPNSSTRNIFHSHLIFLLGRRFYFVASPRMQSFVYLCPHDIQRTVVAPLFAIRPYSANIFFGLVEIICSFKRQNGRIDVKLCCNLIKKN
jgi:hypothetical protein